MERYVNTVLDHNLNENEDSRQFFRNRVSFSVHFTSRRNPEKNIGHFE